jgi:hypothetical protein
LLDVICALAIARADGILDRLVHNAHRIDMRGESMSKKRKTVGVIGAYLASRAWIEGDLRWL